MAHNYSLALGFAPHATKHLHLWHSIGITLPMISPISIDGWNGGKEIP